MPQVRTFPVFLILVFAARILYLSMSSIVMFRKIPLHSCLITTKSNKPVLRRAKLRSSCARPHYSLNYCLVTIFNNRVKLVFRFC